ncbi:hypothetical protein METBIDRAFT_65558 [Metschnikowia bicuspidata var. bicuspidata NRRL YB-4993]|uniref:Abscisic acid G-protein coupled receptor-like domain-containing protein n=1 Tax=Metschnikowia bicuspidata var. bicuspidata NRRL YB-4993 TaxID=869754 RepID=A0A1A0HJ35_9ASCO|nr:hypothetical protein METBIDRAFT_65558 [Metschnikowia bicuspidata var. bicuspidata NRRL YB-4993]OBA24025.1 hypothetical protein METBIDRAFT_65558 [Metschnikowia bicuspidata var. bicuspidata NRRL YB-4993]
MGTVSYVFEALSLVVVFAVFSLWSFKYVFNHDIIRNYAPRTHHAKAQINDMLQHAAGAKYGHRLLRLDVDDELEDEALRPFSAHGRHDTVHYVVGVLFSGVVTLSCELVLLLMIELFGAVALNLAVLRYVIAALVVLVTMVQPPLVILLYVNQRLTPQISLRSPSAILKMVATAALCGVWFAVLSRFGSIAQALGPAAERSFLEEKTNEVVLAGISITALLSGVGCMLTPIRSFWVDGVVLPKIALNTGASETQLNELIQSYNSTQMLKKKRQAELDALLASAAGTDYSMPVNDSLRLLKGSGRRLLSRVQSFTSLSSLTGTATEEEELAREIESLQSLQDLVYADICKKVDAVLRDRGSSVKAGVRLNRLVALGNAMFSVYCVYRIVNVLFLRLPYHYFWSLADLHRETNIIDDGDLSETLNKNTKDALAITIAKLIQRLFSYLPLSETQLVNQVSFILSGSLFVCSFQNVVITFRSLGRFLPTNTTTVDVHVKTLVKHLIVSEFLAIYVIATALLIRSNLPPETATLMLKILSLSPTSGPTSPAQMLREVEFIDMWFDKVFGVSCLGTLFFLAMKLFIESDSIYEAGYDEEMMIEENSALKIS